MKVSVVIVVEAVNDYVREAIEHLLKLDFQDFEILLFLGEASGETFPKTRLLARPDLAGNPSQRRDLSITEAQGEILAFLDDDAYPSVSWLSKALPHFEDERVAAVGGPGVTPPEDDWKRQVSGFVHTSPVGAGSFSFRTRPDRIREVDDFPSMNLLVRKSDFDNIGGFDSNFWPGEDTKLCLDLTAKLSKKIIYDPEVLVYHHRRPIFKGHLLQVGRYGLHRGFFAKVLPRTSRRLIYFLPSMLLLAFFFGLVTTSLFQISNFKFQIINRQSVLIVYLSSITSYFLLLAFNAFWVWQKSKSLKIAFWTIPAIFLTHFWYGFQFIRGIISPRLRR
ncbi:MAG: glycosyltransferase [Patescibacteria group bacterium]|nr:glycosyltransferase [Patescibacteria group bacterium]